MSARKTFNISLTLSMVLALAACGSSTSAGTGSQPASGSGKTIDITMVQGVTGAPFAQTAAAGGRAAAAKVGGVKFEVAGPANIDPTAETKIFQQVATTRPDGIVLQELPPELFTRLVKDAEESGIAVLPYTIAPATNSTSKSFVGDNGRDLGRLAADRIADAIIKTKGEDAAGKIITGICVPGLSVLTQRLDGFTERMSQRLANVTVAKPFDSKTDQAQDFAVWQQAASANPDALAMVSPCELDNQNLVKIKRSSNADWLLTPFDINTEVLNGVKDGSVLAIFPQSSYVHGYVATRLLAESLKSGTPVPAGWIQMPVVPVDKSNLDKIIERESSVDQQAASWQPYIDKIFASEPVSTLPLSDASK